MINYSSSFVPFHVSVEQFCCLLFRLSNFAWAKLKYFPSLASANPREENEIEEWVAWKEIKILLTKNSPWREESREEDPHQNEANYSNSLHSKSYLNPTTRASAFSPLIKTSNTAYCIKRPSRYSPSLNFIVYPKVSFYEWKITLHCLGITSRQQPAEMRIRLTLFMNENVISRAQKTFYVEI